MTRVDGQIQWLQWPHAFWVTGLALPWPGVCWGTIGRCGLLGHCAIIPKESTYTRLQGVEVLPQTTSSLRPSFYGSQTPLDKASFSLWLAAFPKFWTRKGAVSPPLLGSLFLAAYFYHHLLYSPRFHLAKGGNIFSYGCTCFVLAQLVWTSWSYKMIMTFSNLTSITTTKKN